MIDAVLDLLTDKNGIEHSVRALEKETASQTTQTAANASRKQPPRENELRANPEKRQTLNGFENKTVGDEGPELPQKSAGKPAILATGGAESGALDPQLASLLEIWPSLSAGEKTRLLRAAKQMG